MELQVGVKILLKNNEGKYLIVHRLLEKYPGAKGSWDIPGGRINRGETLLANLKREVREETGLALIETPEIFGVQDILRVKNKHIIRLTYQGLTNGKVNLSEEHDDYLWLSLDKLKFFPDLDVYLKNLLISKL